MHERNLRFGLYLSDLNRDKNDSHGIINYSVGLANALQRSVPAHEQLYIYANPAITRELEARISERVTIRITPPPTSSQRMLSDHLLGVKRASDDGVSVLHFPKGFVPILPNRRMKVVATLHDDIPLIYARGEYGREYSSTKSRYFTFSLRHTLRQADGLITVSDTSLGRFMDLAKDANITMPPSFVSYQGITLPLNDSIAVEDKKPYLIHIGSNKPHKRSHQAVEFMLRYVAHTDENLQLLILGPLTRSTEMLLQNNPANRIKRTLSVQELSRMIGQSRALVFNSDREGFGLPPVEAYALGTPAVFARTGVMVEVLGDTPGAYEANDYDDFARALDNALALGTDELAAHRQHILDLYDWDAVARETLKAYRQVASHP
ncbi:MAG: glycosyltransferase [Acidimicrobiia bacterium]|nr:glycosyltransferase [Acidimicrobiia bacterium]